MTARLHNLFRRDHSALRSRLRSVLLLVWSALVAATIAREGYAQSDSRVALVIANADYPDGEGALKELAGNARAFADELKRQGFEVDVGDNLTKEAMRASL